MSPGEYVICVVSKSQVSIQLLIENSNVDLTILAMSDKFDDLIRLTTTFYFFHIPCKKYNF